MIRFRRRRRLWQAMVTPLTVAMLAASITLLTMPPERQQALSRSVEDLLVAARGHVPTFPATAAAAVSPTDPGTAAVRRALRPLARGQADSPAPRMRLGAAEGAVPKETPRVTRGGQAWGGIRSDPAGRPARPAPQAGVLTGPVTHVRDGDTIEVGPVAIRLANLDCAELGTAEGHLAKRRMRALVADRQVHCELTGERSFDRQVGTCVLAGEQDLGALLMAERLCGPWR